MVLLNLKDQNDIKTVSEYLVETNKKSTTVGQIMKKFGISLDEYRMCCNLAVPALARANVEGRYTALRNVNKAMREDIKALYETLKDEDGPGAEGIRMLYNTWCDHSQSVVWGRADDEDEMDGCDSEEGGEP